MPSRADTIDVFGVNRTDGLILLTNDTLVKVDTWIGPLGTVTDDAEEAVACVAQLPDGLWLSVDLTQFQSTRMH